jgi:hypothetical protein
MKSKFFFTVMALLMVLCSYSFAQVPQLINYQGKLTKSTGAPVDTTIPMVFTIYADSGGTISKWSETQTAVKVEKGVFNVLLGSVNPIPDSVFDGSIRYLGVKVGGDPEITPRKAMVSVAYAYRAGVGGGGGDNDWVFPQSAGGNNPRPYLYTYGPWGIARYGNTLYGNADSTHANLGVACTTGTSGQNYKYCTVAGGMGNSASRGYATVGGGERNRVLFAYATVGGGQLNTSSGSASTVGGGQNNSASGSVSTVAGGQNNDADGLSATIGGGYANTSTGANATVGGGYGNSALDSAATVGGGRNNKASGMYSVVSGGGGIEAADSNSASGDWSTVGGGKGNIASEYATTVGGGETNRASESYATIGGGVGNTASYYYATVAGGFNNDATGDRATVGGGQDNVSQNAFSTVGGGLSNDANGNRSTVGGGEDNTASGEWATVSGGIQNRNAGNYSAIPGGYHDTLTLSADYSMGFGNGVYVNASYHVVFFDGTNSGHLQLNRDHRDGVTTYPIRVGTDATNGNGAYLTTGGVWTDISSRSKKEDFQELDGAQVLDKIENMPVTRWKFKGTEERHISPVAQDFYQVFNCGTGIPEDDSTAIAAMDLAGVSLVAIQELTRIIKEQQEQIEALKTKLEKLESKR